MLSDEMKKIVLAGIGAVASTVECSQQVVEKLVKKGELTVEQGKVLNEELKHNIKTTFSEGVKDTGCSAKEPDDLSERLRRMSAEERAKLQRILAEMEQPGETKE